MSINSFIKYKMLAIDLDGTLLTSNKKITKKDMLSLKTYADLGGEIFITTGKCLDSTLKYIRKIEDAIGHELKYCSSLGGAIIYDLKKKVIISKSLIESELCKQVYRICKKLNMTFVPYIEARNGNKKTFIYHYPKFQEMRAFKINAFVSILGIPKMKKLLTKLREVPQVEILTTHYFFYEIVKKGTNKGSALEFVAKKLNINLSDIAAIGDSYNDLAMFKIAGKSFLVKNRDENFKKYIDILIKTKRSKVSHIINEYVLNNKLAS